MDLWRLLSWTQFAFAAAWLTLAVWAAVGDSPTKSPWLIAFWLLMSSAWVALGLITRRRSAGARRASGT
jgi:hypothetical protein